MSTVAAAELARVKAESLRVIPFGEKTSWINAEQSEYYLYEGELVTAADMNGCQILETVVQPVELKLWEEER